MEQGIVKWFSAAKGFGFITRPNDKGDCFVHFSAIDMPGYRTLVEGAKVEYHVFEDTKGFTAQKVKVINAQ